jgi:hypothetical protein
MTYDAALLLDLMSYDINEYHDSYTNLSFRFSPSLCKPARDLRLAMQMVRT